MIVIDASAMVEALVGRDADEALLRAVGGELEVPHLLDADVISTLRGLQFAGHLSADAAERALRDYFSLTITRHETGPLAGRIWQLSQRFTVRDAAYLALAEALDAPLWTSDPRLTSGGHDARIQLVGRTGAPPRHGR